MTAAPFPIGISRLGQIAINVYDLDRATAFYRDILGLPLLFTAGTLGERMYDGIGALGVAHRFGGDL